jgi:signal transduction histidine kinase
MLQEIEITEIDNLLDADKKFVDLHSVLNVMNVLFGELQCLGLDFEDEQILKPSLERCQYILDALHDHPKAIEMVEKMPESEQLIMDNLQKALAQYPEKINSPEVQESIANLQSVFSILEVRVRELIDRWQYPNRWIEFDIEQLKNNFLNFFAAVEKNSKGRYRIIYNLAAQSANDYFVSFNIESPTGKTITIPPAFQDVMRDLIANARKYTPWGGQIAIGLLDDGKNLNFVVEDTGYGIPIDELEIVANMGIRGSNVKHLRTMGDGIGLTKAFLVTKRYGGRMWIASDEQRGTRIRIIIPHEIHTGLVGVGIK